MNTLPFRLSFPFESTDRPRLKMDFHFFDFPENFLLANKQRLLSYSKIVVTLIHTVIIHASNTLHTV